MVVLCLVGIEISMISFATFELCGDFVLVTGVNDMKKADVKISRIIHLVEWLERLAVNAKVATVQGSIPASSDTVKSAGPQMKQ